MIMVRNAGHDGFRSAQPALRVILVLLSLLLLAGCLGGGGKSLRYYLVDPVEVGMPAAGAPLAVEIIDVHIPQYLERFQIAVRTGSGAVSYSDFHQWGENLRKNLMRTLALNLSALLGTTDVSTPLNRSFSKPDWRIHVHIDRFEQDADGTVRLAARWQVIAGEPGSTPATHEASLESDERIGKGDYEGMVAAMRNLYGDLSRRIVNSLPITGSGTY
jgi:uncharacterized lipoprotein YmbA